MRGTGRDSAPVLDAEEGGVEAAVNRARSRVVIVAVEDGLQLQWRQRLLRRRQLRRVVTATVGRASTCAIGQRSDAGRNGPADPW
jgi:hypothetical protein